MQDCEFIEEKGTLDESSSKVQNGGEYESPNS